MNTAAIIFMALGCMGGMGSAHSESKLVLEDFEAYSAVQMPVKGWEEHGGSAKAVYRVEIENQNHFLAARDKGQSVKLFREKGWDLKKHPFVSWRWRVKEFPKDADERLGDKNDSAAGFYVLFPRHWFVPDVIKYVWSEKAPVGTVIRRRDHFPVLVVRTGREGMDQWQEERRNVREDFKKLFDRSAPNPLAFGFLTDANAVKGSASADYDDITIVSE